MKKLSLISYLFFIIPLIYTQEIKVISVADVSFPTTGSSISQSSKIKKIKFHVYGVCEMCKNRIETALDVKGIRLADWNIKTNFEKGLSKTYDWFLNNQNLYLKDTYHE